MRYVLLIYSNEAADANMSEEESREIFQAHMEYSQELGEKGVSAGGDPLLPTSAATTVRNRDGKTLITHGPFAETTEQLGGFYIVECANIDEALEWAAKNPAVRHGSVEVRPVMEIG
jgi:hypothetical protein